MPRSSGNEIVQGYIEEVKTYIPSLTRGLDALRENPEQPQIIEEIHRLVHTIKGASSMVGIYGLSHIAFQMEDALDDIMSGKLTFTEESFKVMSRTVKQFQEYCANFLEKGVKARAMLRETVLGFRRLRNLPPEEDAAALQKLLNIVPEHEGEISHKTDTASPDTDIESLLSQQPVDEDLMSLLESEPEVETDYAITEDSDIENLLNQHPATDSQSLDTSDQDLMSLLESEPEVETDYAITENSDIDNLLSQQPTANSQQPPDKSDEDLMSLLESEPEVETDYAITEDSDIESLLNQQPTANSQQPADDDLMSLLESEPEVETDYAAPDDTDIENFLSQQPTANNQQPTVLPELLESFYEEAEEHLQDLGRSLNILETQVIEPAPISESQREVIRQIRRSVHTLKGASAIIGIPNVSGYAHSFEDLLDWLYESAQEITPEIVSLLADSSGLLERMVATPDDPQTSKVETLRSRYKTLIESGVQGLLADSKPSDDSEPEKDLQGFQNLESLPKSENKKKPAAKSVGLKISDDSKPIKTIQKRSDEPDEPVSEITEIPISSIPVHQSRTLRVGMERVDELVNLAGELIIATSAFDQKMDAFMTAFKELELSRNRLREIARELEVSYEVKSLQAGHRFSTQIEGFSNSTNLRGFENPAGLPADFSSQPFSELEDFDTLELDRYSELNLIIRTLNESVIDVGAINTNLINIYSDFDGHLTRQRVLLSELQDKIMRVRMTPMQIITNKLRRTVHDVSGKLGKKIRLIIEGEDIELDRLVWEKITDPLMHLLRNAADHGIEHPELRQATGKPPIGTIKLSASREGNQVVIRVSDDGMGLNYQAIRETARKTGFADKVDELSEDELAGLIFHPGFSTRGKISEVSGRGVGMDVVKQNIQELKGVIRVTSWKDKGTRFTIRIPLTLAVIRGLLVMVRGRMFAIALNEIKEIVRVTPDMITGDVETLVNLDNEVLPLYYLAKVLNPGAADQDFLQKKDLQGFENLEGLPELGNEKMSVQRPIVLVVEAGEKRVAIVVDSLAGQREIVIKSTGSHLRYVKGVSGVTIMGDGSVIPILNLEQLLQLETTAPQLLRSEELPITEKPLEIMVVDDSVSIRQVVSRLMEEQGWRVQTAKDGIDALEKLRDIRPDLIVLDIEMPRMNGYEFLSAIRVQPAYQDIPVVMLTSRTTSKHRDKAMALGAKGFIAKPYNDDDFINLVLKLTEKV